MSVQCTVCYVVHDTTPVSKYGKVLQCNQCPCHADPEDAKRTRNTSLANHPRSTFNGVHGYGMQGKYYSEYMNIMCVHRCRNRVYRPYTGTKETADKPITPVQHYGIDTVAPEIVGTLWKEGYATVASSDKTGNTRFLKIKVRISESGTGYKVRVWMRDKRVWEDRDKPGFNPEKALAKGTWITVGSIGE